MATPANNSTAADLSASVKAKVSVSLEDQACHSPCASSNHHYHHQVDPIKLRAVYDSMAAKLASDGLDLEAIAANGAYFANLEPHAHHHPQFNIDESALHRGVAMHVEFSRRSLAQIA